MIADLDYCHGAAISGVFRVRRPRMKLAANGNEYMGAYLEDRSGELPAYFWTGNSPAPNFADLERVRVSGNLRQVNGRWIANLHSIARAGDQPVNVVDLLPRSYTPDPSLLYELDAVVSTISNTPLRTFVVGILGDDAVALPFISQPASSRHHHCVGGGLLDHSLETVAMVSRFREFSSAELELAIVGALFHDIGKIRTLHSPGKVSFAGYILDHDDLTLEVLAPYLKQLDQDSPDRAVALRYLWTWRNRGSSRSIPLLTIAEAITAADRISSGLNYERQAFRNTPDWQRFVRTDEKNLHWRPRLAA